jgi:hypothetical protein
MKPLRELILCYDLAVADYALARVAAGPCMVVVNPNNGPGSVTDDDAPRWADLILRLQQVDAARVKALRKAEKNPPELILAGYIDAVTWKGKRWTIKTSRKINAECIKWRSLGVHSIWFDDCFTDQPGNFKDLLLLIRYAPDRLFTLVNPGEQQVPEWMWANADFVCDYEGNTPRSFTGLPKAAPKNKTAVRIARGTKDTGSIIMDVAKAQGLAAVCITDRLDYQAPPSWMVKSTA